MNEMNFWSINAIRWSTIDEMKSDGWMWNHKMKTWVWELVGFINNWPNWMIRIFIDECQAMGWISMDETCSDWWTGHKRLNLS